MAFLTVIAAHREEIPTECPIPERENATHLAHESDCTKFYKCNWGKPVLQDCPLMDEYRRLHYNIHLQVCDWPWQAGCEDCPKPDRNGNYPSPSRISNKDNCNSYWECINGDKIPRKCERGLCFSRRCQKCVKNPSSDKCDGDPICTKCYPGDRKAHECQAHQYYECIDCEWVLRYCERGCHFDCKSKKCRDSRNIECRDLGY